MTSFGAAIFSAVLATGALAAATGFTAAFVSALGATLAAAGFAVLLGISLLLFFEGFALGDLALRDLALRDLALRDLAAVTFALVRVSLTEARARPLVARPLLRVGVAATDFFEAGFEDTFDGETFTVFKTLFLRVFCDTACARELPRPCLMLNGEPDRATQAAP